MPKISPGKGKRLIILHAGCEDGFITNMDLVFECRKQGDYHAEMNSVVFLDWFEKLCMGLEQPSFIVIDNASQHNTRTQSTWARNSSATKQ